MFCTKCGSKVEKGSTFCDICGERVDDGITPGTPVGPGKRRKKFPWIILIFPVIVIGVIVILLNIHKCTMCNKTYIGAQYYDVLFEDELMCGDCAEDYYMGMPYKNFKK